MVRYVLKHCIWFELVLSWSRAGLSWSRVTHFCSGPAYNQLRASLNQLKPATMFQNIPNQHMQFCFYSDATPHLQNYISKPITHQVRCNTSANTEPNVNIDRVTAVLGDLSESRQRSRNGKGEHQNGFEQLGAIRDCWVEVHLEEQRAAEVSSCHVQINNILLCSFRQSDKRKVGSSNNLSPRMSLEVDPAK